MELQTITLDRKTAREKAAEYLKAVRERHDEEDKAILAGYRWLAKGVPLLDLPDAIRRGGADERGRPLLAVARSDWRRVRVDCWRPWGGDAPATCTFGVPDPTWRNALLGGRYRRRVELGADWWQALAPAMEPGRSAADSPVPIVPPALRPKTHLRNYYTLFEADWHSVPADPALLKHCGGDLYAVLAVWDLTELERTVLAGSRAS